MKSNLASRSDRAALWKEGAPLGLSWLTYGDERQLALQAEARGTPQARVFEELMIGEIAGRIADGELIAVGYQLEPQTSDGPVQLPADLFEGRLGSEVLESQLHVGAESFDRIRVLDSTALHTASPPVEESPNALAPEDPEQTTGAKPGPQSAGPILRALYAELLEGGAIPTSHTRVQAHAKVAKAAQQRHPEFFKGGRGLSYASFCRHLDAAER